MLCLGIETSCDETGLALVEDGRLIAQSLSTQEDLHALFGGVVPELASREHLRILPPLYSSLMDKSGKTLADVDVIAVARGPGLLGSLLVGMSFAKGLCLACKAGLVGVNHLNAHLLAPGLDQELEFPALGVLVSGGHTNLYRMVSPVRMELLGKTLDDAAGEAFDKSAKALNFPYPGGRIIDELACGVAPDKSLLPRPYLDNDNLDFSFSGLKTAVLNHIRSNPEIRSESMGIPAIGHMGEHEDKIRLLCSSLNWSIASTLSAKAARAVKSHGPFKSVVVAGGVAANSGVRSEMAAMCEKFGLKLTLPGLNLCTDNGAMIAYAGNLLAGEGYFHGLDLEAVPRGRAVPFDYVRRTRDESR